MWEQYIEPRYVREGVSAFWLDETDGEGTLDGDGTRCNGRTWIATDGH